MANEEIKERERNPIVALCTMLKRYLSSRSTTKRSIVAFIVAPMFGSYVYALLLCSWTLFYHPTDPTDILLFAALLAMAGASLAYAGIVLIGLPAWVALRRLRAEGFLTYALAGLFGGSIVPFLLPGLSVVSQGPLHHCQVAGIFVMGSFWLIAKERTRRESVEG